MSKSLIQENSIGASKGGSSAGASSMEPLVAEYLKTGNLPPWFSRIGPTTNADAAKELFELYLQLVANKPDKKMHSNRSVRTYKSNINVWVRQYATGHELQHVLHPKFIQKTQRSSAAPGHLKRVTPQQQPGLKHFVNMYEACCKQFHKGLEMYELKDIEIRVAKKMKFEEVPTAVSERRPDYAKRFVREYMFRHGGTLPTTSAELEQCVAQYGFFEAQRQLAYAWGKSNVTAKVLLVNTEDDSMTRGV
jgi:hypothetical protein